MYAYAGSYPLPDLQSIPCTLPSLAGAYCTLTRHFDLLQENTFYSKRTHSIAVHLLVPLTSDLDACAQAFLCSLIPRSFHRPPSSPAPPAAPSVYSASPPGDADQTPHERAALTAFTSACCCQLLLLTLASPFFPASPLRLWKVRGDGGKDINTHITGEPAEQLHRVRGVSLQSGAAHVSREPRAHPSLQA